MTERGFLAWYPDEIRAEWVNGSVILFPARSIVHSELVGWLICVIGGFVERRELGVIRARMLVRLPRVRSYRLPDLCYTHTRNLHIIEYDCVVGAPDLIVEIISPDSQSRDRREKFEEYEKAGVREYWIIDPLSKTAEAYRLAGKKFQLIEEQGGVLASAVLRNFWIKTDWFWRKPLPKVSVTLKQMRGKPPRH
jgi:Uma2 family endonuclease